MSTILQNSMLAIVKNTLKDEDRNNELALRETTNST